MFFGGIFEDFSGEGMGIFGDYLFFTQKFFGNWESSKKKLRNFSKKFRGLVEKVRSSSKRIELFFLFFNINLSETPIFVHTFSKPHIFVSHIQQRIFWTWIIKGKKLLIGVIIDPSLSTAFIRNERVLNQEYLQRTGLIF